MAKVKRPDLTKLKEQLEQAKLDGNHRLIKFYTDMINRITGSRPR